MELLVYNWKTIQVEQGVRMALQAEKNIRLVSKIKFARWNEESRFKRTTFVPMLFYKENILFVERLLVIGKVWTEVQELNFK